MNYFNKVVYVMYIRVESNNIKATIIKSNVQKNDNQKTIIEKENQTLVRLRSLAEIWKLKKIKSVIKHCIFVYWGT